MSVGVEDGLETGKIYRYVLKVKNEFGDSPQSEQIRIAMSSLPAFPDAPTKVENLSSISSIAV